MVKLPCPPGHMDGLWGNPTGYEEKYLREPEGYYNTGDNGYIDKDGYVFVLSRTDDVINVAGHRLSAGRIEEVILLDKDIAECACIGQINDLKGEVPFVFAILNLNPSKSKEEISKNV